MNLRELKATLDMLSESALDREIEVDFYGLDPDVDDGRNVPWVSAEFELSYHGAAPRLVIRSDAEGIIQLLEGRLSVVKDEVDQLEDLCYQMRQKCEEMQSKISKP